MTTMFADISKLPYRAIPTEVLVSMRDRIAKELNRRGYVGGDEVRRPRDGGLFGRRDIQHESDLAKLKGFSLLDAVIAEDWSGLFPEGSLERRFYVYAHVHPRKRILRKGGAFPLEIAGFPFYIGKGTGNRAWELNRNEGHGVELKQLRDRGVSPSEIVWMVRDGLTEREALELESKLIYFFGTKFEKGCKGVLVNLDFPARPRREADVRDLPRLAEVARRLGIEAEAEAA